MGLKDGFSILTPYHKARDGFLCKMPVNPAKFGKQIVPFTDCIGFTVSNRAKLTYHSDGFVQFSSEKVGQIISGRNPFTGLPKGCALITHPLKTPILSGPSASVTFWGLQDYEPLNGSDQDVLIFHSQNFFDLDCSLIDANSWTLEIWVYPPSLVAPFCRRRGDHLIFENTVRARSGLLLPKAYSILPLPSQNIYLGLAINNTQGHFPPASGWMIDGPGDWAYGKKGYVLTGCYPRQNIPTDNVPSLDR